VYQTFPETCGNAGVVKMETEYDVIIMGAGVAGGVAASKLARAGMKIAVIESREYGGTCALRGCVPKKP
jgi:glutathione reductase (NADPH)